MQIHEITLKEASGGAGAFSQMAQQLQPKTGTVSSSSGGTTTRTPQGLVHSASLDNPNPRATPPTQQQLYDREYRRLRNQFPGLTTAQYQKAMAKRGYTQPPPAPIATAQPAPVAPVQSVPQPTAKPVAPRPTVAPATTQYPPITLGTGPQAQVFVNKGRGYVDSKTNKPMPPAIVKAMGL